MFKKPIYTDPNDYLQEVNQDTALMTNTIHDEVNYGIDKFLLKPMLKKLVMLGTAKDIMNRFGLPYMNFLYDVEFSYTGEFTGEGYEGVADFSIYETPLHKEEHIAKNRFEKALKAFEDVKEDNIKITNIAISMTLFKKKQLDKKIKRYHLDDEPQKEAVALTVTDGEQSYKYSTLLKPTIKKLIRLKKPSR